MICLFADETLVTTNLSSLFYYDWIKVSLAYSKKWKIYMMAETEGQLWETYIILGIVS